MMTNEIFRDELLRVRTYDCDSLGHVNNAVYVQWLQQLTIDAAKAVGLNDPSVVWWPQALTVEYRAPARDGNVLALATWVLESEHEHLTRGYHIRHENGDVNGIEAHVASARIEWLWRDRKSGQPRSMPILPTSVSSEVQPQLKSFSPPNDNTSHWYRWQHNVRRYELDGTGQVGIAAWFRWLEEVTFRATEAAGWSLARMREIDFMSFQRRHDTTFFAPAQPIHVGDELEIISRLAGVRRIHGMWLHEVYQAQSGVLLMRDYSTGAFVTWSGQVRSAPMDMMTDLLKGPGQ
jgi:acyl-CoA thioester hydrolase